ncbi:MAG: ATP-binding cassette domain-containing protein [Gammaproteobacteria bacterium]|nr:ATP-binding cassette domain-containing protein [Gammaproteobacteria bacterium]MBT8106482.1 ATP-binding cassette domain-containing protein [Gammaproteobacteria bacterium]NNF49373.1 ATP-binding cassette domain-containing protein [Woeseiaceae bacterium]NNK26497.1 ATP-binding cassette domain-containing protein [Woeseiaceae bacterium]NNL62589.1 ATP-binding cassette domain-containing protein [Woeseiaceae bacterium]
MRPEPPLVEIGGATIWRGSTLVFDNLDLVIEQHERVAIVGPNGSGKTTLLKTFNRELYPVVDPGTTFRILGRERWNVWELRKRVGVVSQDLQQRYTPTTTALEVVVSGFHSSIGVHGILADRVSEEQVGAARATLTDVGIGELAATPLKSMSTGQQRRCILARALVHRPQTLILDEPTAGLDFAASFDYLARIRALSASGHNIVIVTHHLNEIPPEVERIILLQEGRIVGDGNKRDILTDEHLSRAYGVSVRVREIDGYFFAYPDPHQET